MFNFHHTNARHIQKRTHVHTYTHTKITSSGFLDGPFLLLIIHVFFSVCHRIHFELNTPKIPLRIDVEKANEEWKKKNRRRNVQPFAIYIGSIAGPNVSFYVMYYTVLRRTVWWYWIRPSIVLLFRPKQYSFIHWYRFHHNQHPVVVADVVASAFIIIDRPICFFLSFVQIEYRQNRMKLNNRNETKESIHMAKVA